MISVLNLILYKKGCYIYYFDNLLSIFSFIQLELGKCGNRGQRKKRHARHNTRFEFKPVCSQLTWNMWYKCINWLAEPPSSIVFLQSSNHISTASLTSMFMLCKYRLISCPGSLGCQWISSGCRLVAIGCFLNVYYFYIAFSINQINKKRAFFSNSLYVNQ